MNKLFFIVFIFLPFPYFLQGQSSLPDKDLCKNNKFTFSSRTTNQSVIFLASQGDVIDTLAISNLGGGTVSCICTDTEVIFLVDSYDNGILYKFNLTGSQWKDNLPFFLPQKGNRIGDMLPNDRYIFVSTYVLESINTVKSMSCTVRTGNRGERIDSETQCFETISEVNFFKKKLTELSKKEIKDEN